jgi:hypothetical protein
MRERWRQFCGLAGDERRLLLLALLALPLSAAALRLAGFRRWQRALTRLAPPGSAVCASDWRQGLRAARLVELAARRGPVRGNCLSQSLTLWWLLRRQGVGSELRIGVCVRAGQFAAHAWVEQAGVVLNDSADVGQRFAPFDAAFGPAAEASR